MMLINPYRFSAAAPTPPPPPNPNLIALHFEQANGSTTFIDDGSASSTWTGGGAFVMVSTTSPLAGAGSLQGTTHTNLGIRTAAVPGVNMLPATADWRLSFKFKAASYLVPITGTGFYILSIQGITGGGTPAETQIVIATNYERKVAVFLSDGITRDLVILTSMALVGGTAYSFKLERVSNIVTLYLDDTDRGSATYSKSLNQPTGRQWRVGQPEYDVVDNGPTPPWQFDDFVLTLL